MTETIKPKLRSVEAIKQKKGVHLDRTLCFFREKIGNFLKSLTDTKKNTEKIKKSITLLNDEQDAIYQQAFADLVICLTKSTTSTIIEFISSDMSIALKAAIENALRGRNNLGESALVSNFLKINDKKKGEYASIIGNLKIDLAVEPLSSFLSEPVNKDSNPQVMRNRENAKRKTAWALGEIATPAAREALIKNLYKLNSLTQKEIVKALIKIGGLPAFKALKDYYFLPCGHRCSDLNIERDIISFLAENDPNIMETFLEFLFHKSSAVRQNALQAICYKLRCDHIASMDITEWTEDNKEQQVPLDFKRYDLVEILMNLLSDVEMFTQTQIVETLLLANDPKITMPLIRKGYVIQALKISPQAEEESLRKEIKKILNIFKEINPHNEEAFLNLLSKKIDLSKPENRISVQEKAKIIRDECEHSASTLVVYSHFPNFEIDLIKKLILIYNATEDVALLHEIIDTTDLSQSKNLEFIERVLDRFRGNPRLIRQTLTAKTLRFI